MSFKEWLPITTRNREALVLAFAGLVMFVIWNCLPYYESADTPSGKIAAVAAWPEFFDPGNYLDVIRSPDMDGLLSSAASMGVIFGGLIVLMAVPLWQILHASPFIRLPIALMNLLGGAVVTWYIFLEVSDPNPAPYWITTLTLMATGMFSVSAAFFLFKNELALREERDRPKVG